MNKDEEMYSSVSIPSSIDNYGTAIEYMKTFFLSKFNKNYFKTYYLDGHNLLDDFRSFNSTSNLKKLKPAVSVIPQLNFNFDREKLDLAYGGLNSYLKKSKLDASFFKDVDRNMYIGIILEQMEMAFTFKIKLSTRAQQVDLFKYMQMAFKIGMTSEDFIDMDIHIPYVLMVQCAKDSEFEVIDNKITNVVEFLAYLNTNSLIPIIFKFRTINGKSEFFLRFREMYMHLNNTEPLQMDDGDREGMVQSNFTITMNIVLKMPAPKMFVYHSKEEHDIIVSTGETSPDSTNIGLFSIKVLDVPEINSKGWHQYLTTEYSEEDISKPLVIDFGELFEGDIRQIIEYNNAILISSSIFIDFKIFNSDEEIKSTIDWETMILTSDDNMKSEASYISIYVDLAYLNTSIMNLKEINKG